MNSDAATITPSLQAADKLHKPIHRKRKLYSPFMDSIWDSDLADMQLITRYNKQI